MSCPNYVNAFGLEQYNGNCSMFGDGKPILSQAMGYFIVVGLGLAFSIMTSLMVWLDEKFGGEYHSSEAFSTAGRSMKVGLTACDIVSKWTWAATLLQSSNVAWQFGVSGPFWYAAGATIQVLLFSVLAIEIKRKAPTAHTVMEIIKARWGKTAHKVFLCFCIATNIIVTAMLILGGASVVTALTGTDIYLNAFLIPLGVCIYTAHGGLRGTYIAAWAHVAVIYIALLTFAFLIYATPGSTQPVGSISKVYDNLQKLAGMSRSTKDGFPSDLPVEGNSGGSFLTMMSKSGLIFGVINIAGNFGTVFVDQAYWQCAIAAKPSATYKGYLLGGLSWFAVPFCMATAMGLGARALDLPLTAGEASAGLVPPAVAVHLMGPGGGFLLVFQLFMAVTAAGSAEQIAFASLCAYDVYRDYFNKKATGRQLVLATRIMVCVYGVISGCLAIILLKLNLSLGWVYLFMGVVIGGAVLPFAFSITWRNCSAAGAMSGAIVGTAGALITWLVTAKAVGGEITLKTTGGDFPMLAGNIVAICLSGVVCVVVSMIKPQEFNWSDLKEIPTIEEEAPVEDPEGTPEALDKALHWTYWTGGVLSLVMVIFWPLLALPAGVFTKGYFTMWIIIAMVWGIFGAVCTLIMPIWEARETLVAVLTWSVPQKKQPKQQAEFDVK